MVLVARLQKKILRVLGRALTIRHVDAGSCNGCELEIHALANPYYNIEGLGIRFVASPRHADLLLVTGPVSKHMVIALKRTYDATPDPKLVVAVGDCGCSGGIFGESYASLGRVSNVIPVDVAIPGCPPAPVALLQGILAAVSVAAPAAESDTELAAQLAAEARTEPTLEAGAAGLPETAAEPSPDVPAGKPPTRIGDPP
jgi:Ni,Fe-hydrogenase III small subunit